MNEIIDDLIERLAVQMIKEKKDFTIEQIKEIVGIMETIREKNFTSFKYKFNIWRGSKADFPEIILYLVAYLSNMDSEINPMLKYFGEDKKSTQFIWERKEAFYNGKLLTLWKSLYRDGKVGEKIYGVTKKLRTVSLVSNPLMEALTLTGKLEAVKYLWEQGEEISLGLKKIGLRLEE